MERCPVQSIVSLHVATLDDPAVITLRTHGISVEVS